VAGQRILVQHLTDQRAEPFAESDMVFRRHMLVAQHDHAMVEMRPVDRVEFPVTQIAHVDADDLRAQHLGQWV
jgi:hypothetical protein